MRSTLKFELHTPLVLMPWFYTLLAMKNKYLLLINLSSMNSRNICTTKYMPFSVHTAQINQNPSCLGQLHHDSCSKIHCHCDHGDVYQSDAVCHPHRYHLHQMASVYERYSISWNSSSAWTHCLRCPLSTWPSSSDWGGEKGLQVAVVLAEMKRMTSPSFQLLW